ncbi:MAG: secretin and TonB N-terminal domain-containing protein, partial [Bacteroidales bacterium]|nr:secretin and TonB N-terminal domain-containing protein [Bacteroidales bacterium]
MRKKHSCSRVRETILLLGVIVSLLIPTGFIQAQSITLNLKDAPLKEVLKAVEKQTDYTFVYNNNLVNANKTVTVNISKADIKTTMTAVLKNTGYEYKIVEKQIVISPLNLFDEKLEKQSAVKNTTVNSDQNTFEIKGKIVDDKDAPLPGAYVKIKDSKEATVTDNKGNYQLNYKGGEITLVVSFI